MELFSLVLLAKDTRSSRSSSSRQWNARENGHLVSGSMWYLSSGWKIFQVVLPSMTPWVVEAVWVVLVQKECFSCSGKEGFEAISTVQVVWGVSAVLVVQVVLVCLGRLGSLVSVVVHVVHLFFLVLVVQVACAVNIAEVVLFMLLWLFGLL